MTMNHEVCLAQAEEVEDQIARHDRHQQGGGSNAMMRRTKERLKVKLA
jgi:uncharacterized protein YdcH (DUF465 family)